jgi:AcrR family transcriptional regulator
MNRTLVQVLPGGQGDDVRNATEAPGPAPRGQPRQARSRDKLGRILAAAAELLQEYSYDELGTRLIAERAGVSVGTLYRFFPDKDSIARALLLGWLDDAAAFLGWEPGGEVPDRPGAILDRAIDSYADFFRREPGFRNAFYHAQRSPELERAQRQNDRDLASRLHDLLRTGYGRRDPGLAARCLIAIQVADHLLGLAFRDQPDGDAAMLAETKLLLRRYLDV